jgi:hypothetical protein
MASEQYVEKRSFSLYSVLCKIDGRFLGLGEFINVGFKELCRTDTNYFWIKGSEIMSSDINPTNLSEIEKLRTNGWLKCIDCGLIILELTL